MPHKFNAARRHKFDKAQYRVINWAEYNESLGQRGDLTIWVSEDSLGLREFLGLKVSESPSDHSTISRTRRLIDVATHEAVFDWVLKRIGASGLLRGKTIGIDATTLEANAALRSQRAPGQRAGV